MTSPSPMNKRPRFDNMLISSSNHQNQEDNEEGDKISNHSVRLCTLSPNEINLGEEEHICFFDRNGWVLSINSKGTIGAWEIHHTLEGEAPRAPRKVYTFEQPHTYQRGETTNNERTLSFACLLSAGSSSSSSSSSSDIHSERRALIAGSISGDLCYWSDVKTHLGHAVSAVTHSLRNDINDRQNDNGDGDYLVSLVPLDGRTDEVIACTQQGRVFRIVCNGR